ncbi:alpha/beta-hydrolase [Athelia psychrophila]|uniref:Alpha/beta-hydrolase n=1 Tax=Athelia psychrophila TaxID=1759441 RepID=A0A166TGJ5_9AGAM|nr:alpha/beta-hydrolase [Fibularhizoctonia sp. CBS 109695]
MENPPVRLVKIAIGDGTLGSDVAYSQAAALSVLETYPQLIDYDPVVYSHFKEQEHLCGYDLNLTYPQTGGHFPDLQFIPPSDPNAYGNNGTKTGALSRLSKRAFVEDVNSILAKRAELEEVTTKRGKRDLTGRSNGTIDSWYGCDLYDELIYYVVNYTYPWNASTFDVYNIPDALYPAAPQDPSVFLNDNRTRAAIHAPTSKDWALNFDYPFGNSYAGSDPSVESMAFLSELATNASKHNIGVVIYSGNDDSLVPHRGSEIAIQNTTFGGIQGFTRKPSTPWYDLDGTFAGIIHQERNWTYALVKGAGHQVPLYQPKAAYTLLREFILGSNRTGLVTQTSSPAVGGESVSLAAEILPGGAIYVGSGTTQSTYYAPTATVKAWNAFITTAAPSGDFPAAGKPTATPNHKR